MREYPIILEEAYLCQDFFLWARLSPSPTRKVASARPLSPSTFVASWADLEQDVLLIDADAQGSAMRWSTHADGLAFQVISISEPTLHREAPKLARKYDVVVIDCGPAIGEVIRSALAKADLVICPVQPSPFDLWSATASADLIGEAKTANPKMKSRLLISRRIASTRLGAQARDVAATCGIAVLKTEIRQRIALAESILVGQTIGRYAPRSAAAEEFRNLTKEVLACLQQRNQT